MIRRAAESAAAALLGHPRHAALLGLVAGLALARAPHGTPLAMALALSALPLAAGRLLGRRAWGLESLGAAAPIGRPGAAPALVALAMAAAVLAGAVVGEARLRVVDSGRLAAASGEAIAVPVGVVAFEGSVVPVCVERGVELLKQLRCCYS